MRVEAKDRQDSESDRTSNEERDRVQQDADRVT
jgi:hypothetical protein